MCAFLWATWLLHMWNMAHSYLQHDSFLCAAQRTHLYVRHAALILRCDLTHSYVRQDSLICETWRIHVCNMAHSHELTTHSHVRHDAIICVTDVAHANETWRNRCDVRHDALVCVLSIVDNELRKRLRQCRHWRKNESWQWLHHDSFLCAITVMIHLVYCVQLLSRRILMRRNSFFVRHDALILMCDMTQSYVRHDTFVCGKRRISLCNVTRFFMCDIRHSFSCATWRNHLHKRHVYSLDERVLRTHMRIFRVYSLAGCM